MHPYIVDGEAQDLALANDVNDLEKGFVSYERNTFFTNTYANKCELGGADVGGKRTGGSGGQAGGRRQRRALLAGDEEEEEHPAAERTGVDMPIDDAFAPIAASGGLDSPSAGCCTFRIGSACGAGNTIRGFDGFVDEVGVWNRALTAEVGRRCKLTLG